jgi:hypothetical protein
MRALIRRYPVFSFVALAYGLTWALLPLAHRHTFVAVLTLLCPAMAAFAIAHVCGQGAVHELRAALTRWRLHPRWYVLALTLPLPISLLAGVLERAWGAAGPISPAPLSWLGMVVFVMVLGEEIGWRGFALPRLLQRWHPALASIFIGVIWAVWHLPLFFMDGMPQYGSPFGAYMLYTTGLSVILTMLAIRTGGSLVIATLFHGAVNTFILVNAGASPAQRGWGNAAAFGLAAFCILMFWWMRPAAPDPQRPAPAGPP